MKTNQIMVRPMGGFSVIQRTKDGMFNATALLKQWNESTGMKKELDDYLDNKSTQEFITALVSEENLHGGNSPYVKSKARIDRGGGTWMHPLMFIDFAMWINPAFKVKVLKFVYDQMLKYRNDAGDAYKELSAAVSTIVSKDFMPCAMKKIAEALNYVVYNKHEKMIRNNNADEETMKELFMLERRVSENIHDGFIKNFDEVIGFLRRKYSERNYPKVFNN